MTKPRVIFFGNGPLADYALEVLKDHLSIVFHARTREDLEEVKRLKSEDSGLHGVLASYGVIIKQDILDLFEPEGILNIHPSLLPEYRGPSPIETAIKDGKTTFGVSVMKLVKAMDAGPLYYQTSLDFDKTTPKSEIYKGLAEAGATWIADHLEKLTELGAANTSNTTTTTSKALSNLVPPTPQQGEPTFTKMLDKSLSHLNPLEKTADELLDEIRAYQGFPKSKYELFGLDCIIISAHIGEDSPLTLPCKNGTVLSIDKIQPAGRKIMDVKSFLNGYAK